MRTTGPQASEASRSGPEVFAEQRSEDPASSTDVEDSDALERRRWELSGVSDPSSIAPATLATVQLPRAVSDNSSRSDQGWKVQPIGERVRENTRQGVVANRQAERPFMARSRASAEAPEK